MLAPRFAWLLAAALFGIAACGSDTKNTEVTNERTGLTVRATMSAADLGEGASNIQIAFFASQASEPAVVVLKNVELLDNDSGNTVATLASRSPQVWNGSSYVAWNERITPGGDLQASYTLQSPPWSQLDGGRVSRVYRLRATFEIDGQEVVLESGELHREVAMPT